MKFFIIILVIHIIIASIIQYRLIINPTFERKKKLINSILLWFLPGWALALNSFLKPTKGSIGNRRTDKGGIEGGSIGGIEYLDNNPNN